MSQFIDLDKVLDRAYIGVRRASVFMGLGVNAASDERLADYTLDKHSNIRLIPEKQTSEVVSQWKQEFRRWIIQNGLRELLENYEAYLLKLYDVCLRCEVSAGKTTGEVAQKRFKRFDRSGFGEKLDFLNSVGIATKNIDHLKTLYDLRNCLTHRQGIVGPADCKDDKVPGNLIVRWTGFDIEGQDPNGVVQPLAAPYNAPINEAVYFPEGGNIIITTCVRRLELPIGTVVDLTPSQLSEICAFVANEARPMLHSAIEFMEHQCGVSVRAKDAFGAEESQR